MATKWQALNPDFKATELPGEYPQWAGLAAIKSLIVSLLEWFGELGIFCGRLARAAVSPPYELAELIRQCDEVGSKSLPLVALAGAATGVVMSLQTRAGMIRFGGKSLIPVVLIFSIIKESGPTITGLIVSGRVGAGIGAELGSMKVTEQIDAMEASAVNPYKYLVATRVLACTLMLPLLTLVADFAGILMGWIACTLAQPITLRLFLDMGLKSVTFNDFLPPTFKTAVFGLIIGLIACFQGMRTKGGTAGSGAGGHDLRVLVIPFCNPCRRLVGSTDPNVFSLGRGAMERNEVAVELQNVHKSFGPQTVLKGVDLAVGRGETLSVLGRSGTGKSVLLRLIVGLQKPDSGSIRVHGQEITGLPLDELNEVRKKIGFLFQQAALYDSLTVEENVAFPLRRHTQHSCP